MALAPFLMALGSLRAVREVKKNGFDFDLIDAHFLYPDGLAAILLGKWFKKPVVVTCRGSDVNLHLLHRISLLLTRWLIKRAAAIITVCEALKTELTRFRVVGPKVTVLRNGVDLKLFHPVDRDVVRSEMGLTGLVLISVGRLAELKGHDLTIQAMLQIPDSTLLLVGDGPERANLQALAQRLGLSERVRFLGRQPQEKLKNYYSAADISVLSSSREGWANVLLESMACGTPVVATDVGGNGEVVTSEKAGVLVKGRSAESIAAAINQYRANPTDRVDVIRYAEQFNWETTSTGQNDLFAEQVLEREKMRQSRMHQKGEY